MLLRDALKKLKFDRRLQEYNIDKGILTEGELSSHINSLEDSQGASEPMRFREERRQPEEPRRSQSESSHGYSQNSQGNGGGSGGNPFGNGSHY